MNLIRSLTTLSLFILFAGLVFLVFNKKTKKHYDDAAMLPFKDGDERSQRVNSSQIKVDKP